MIPIRIILDLEEVVCDMMKPLISMHHDRYNSDVTIEDVIQWDLPRDMVQIFIEPGFFLHLPPIPGAIDGVRDLLSWGHEIIIATNHSNNDYYIAADKVLWVQRNLPMLSSNIMIGSRKDVLQGDIIIDDNPDYLINSPCPIRIVVDRPWNREHIVTMKDGLGGGEYKMQLNWFGVNDNFYRVYNWQDILKLFEGGAFKVW